MGDKGNRKRECAALPVRSFDFFFFVIIKVNRRKSNPYDEFEHKKKHLIVTKLASATVNSEIVH